MYLPLVLVVLPSSSVGILVVRIFFEEAKEDDSDEDDCGNSDADENDESASVSGLHGITTSALVGHA